MHEREAEMNLFRKRSTSRKDHGTPLPSKYQKLRPQDTQTCDGETESEPSHSEQRPLSLTPPKLHKRYSRLNSTSSLFPSSVCSDGSVPNEIDAETGIDKRWLETVITINRMSPMPEEPQAIKARQTVEKDIETSSDEESTSTFSDLEDLDDADPEMKEYAGLLTPKLSPPRWNRSTSNIFPRTISSSSLSHLEDMNLHSHPITTDTKDESITINTYKLANSSGFGLLEASFVMNARRRSIDRSPSPILNPSKMNNLNRIDDFDSNQFSKSILSTTNQHHPHLVRSPWLSSFMNSQDDHLHVISHYAKCEGWYIGMYIVLLIVDFLLFIVEIGFETFLVHFIPELFVWIRYLCFSSTDWMNGMVAFCKEMLALNDWTQRESWKTRARRLYEQSAQRHKFFLVEDDEEDENFDQSMRMRRSKRRIIGRKHSENMISTEIGTCLICLSSKKEMALRECGHIVSCQQCIKTLKKCPVCRTTIVSQPLRLFT